MASEAERVHGECLNSHWLDTLNEAKAMNNAVGWWAAEEACLLGSRWFVTGRTHTMGVAAKQTTLKTYITLKSLLIKRERS